MWTLCRIFKRTTNYKRCIPDWRVQQTTRQSIIGDNASSKNAMNLKDMSIIQLTKSEAMEAVHGQQEQRNQFYIASDQISMARSSYSSSSNTTTFWNSPKVLDSYFIGDNPHDWDELKSVVDLATDPQSFCYSHT